MDCSNWHKVIFACAEGCDDFDLAESQMLIGLRGFKFEVQRLT